MALLKDVTTLIRLPNLVIVVLTQILVYFGMIEVVLERNGISPNIGKIGFIEGALITLSVVVCSYLVNDLMDVQADRINKPDRQIVGKSIAPKSIKWSYAIIALIGFIICGHFTYERDALEWLFLYPASLALLAFYSFRLKRIPVLGNLVVAAFSSFTVLIIPMFEWQNFERLAEISPISHSTLLLILQAFILFAFITSFFREVVKDIEDFDGDHAAAYRTTAVGLGIINAKIIAFTGGFLLMTALLFWSFSTLNKMNLTLQLYGLLLALYNALLLYRLYVARMKKDYSELSRSIKWLMAAGLMYLLLYHFLIYK
jgi:4-hydroxybenzoate polyprenyltransferase